MKAALLPYLSNQCQPTQMPAPQAASPVVEAPSLQALFGASQQDADLGFIPGMYNAFKGPNAGALISTQNHPMPGQAPIHPSMKDFGADGSFLDKLPGKKRTSRTALANSLDSSRKYDPNTTQPRTKEELDQYQREIVAGA